MTESRTLVMGEALIDFLPHSAGSLAEVETFTRRPGGAPANVAVALARLERPPLFWTRIGTDPFGDVLARTLADEGVPDRFVERDPAAKTSLAFVSEGEEARFSFYRDGTADTRLEAGAVPDEVLRETAWVHVGGVTLASEPARTATLDLVERAGERDCTVSFDPNARPELWPDEGAFADAVAALLPLVDVVKATPADLAAAGMRGTPAELARTLCNRGPHTALLTLGAAGAYAYATETGPHPEESRHPGYDVEAVDATGAGDAFTAGAIAALDEGAAIDDALAFANAVAASTTTKTGAMAALPDRATAADLSHRRNEGF